MNAVAFRLLVLATVMVVLLAIGTVGFMILEDLSFPDALYFTIVTISTVGYGDIHPSGLGGRVLALILILTGVGTFLGVVANATQMLLVRRDERRRRERLNVLVGVFFSEIGTCLLQLLCRCDPDIEQLRRACCVDENWTDQHFAQLGELLGSHTCSIEAKQMHIEHLREFLRGKSDLLIRLLENPSLQEHEAFTDLLQAIFHLRDEMILRPERTKLPDTDLAHLANDARRVYVLLVREWGHHMYYLKSSYPYLFSLGLRTNPFSETASPIVE